MPPLLPGSAAELFVDKASLASPVAIFITRTALPITSAFLFWPWGPLGMGLIHPECLEFAWEALKGSEMRNPVKVIN